MKPLSIDRYKDFCGPTTLAALMDCTREEAAEFLTQEGCNIGNGGTDGMGWHRVLKSLGGKEVDVYDPQGHKRYQKAEHAYLFGTRTKYPSLRLSAPTVAKFLRQHPKGLFVLWTTVHTLLARDGEVIADTQRSKSKRARMRNAYKFPD